MSAVTITDVASMVTTPFLSDVFCRPYTDRNHRTTNTPRKSIDRRAKRNPPMTDYLITLQQDLAFHQARLAQADPEAVPVLRQSIEAIEKDLARCMEIWERAEKAANK